MDSTPSNMQNVWYVAAAAALGAAAAVFLATWSWNWYEQRQINPFTQSVATDFPSDPSCNVLGIQIRGQIVGSRADVPLIDVQVLQRNDGSSYTLTPNYTIADETEDSLRNAASDDSIKGLIVDIDSGGGAVVGGQEIAKAIKQIGKPSVSVIRDLGASAAYMAAAAADTVFATNDSAVGSIGVTSSFSTQASKTTKDGLVFEQLSSGKFKDTFNPQKPLTDSERELIMRDVKISRDHFVQMVSDYRGLSYEDVDKIADGSTVLGGKAVELGLIDNIGGISDAIDSLQKKIGEPVSICWR